MIIMLSLILNMLYFLVLDFKFALLFSGLNLVFLSIILINKYQQKEIKRKRKEIYKIICNYYSYLYCDSEYVFDYSLIGNKTKKYINEQNDIFSQLDSYYSLEEFSVFYKLIINNNNKKKLLNAFEDLIFNFDLFSFSEIEKKENSYYKNNLVFQILILVVIFFIKFAFKDFFLYIVNNYIVIYLINFIYIIINYIYYYSKKSNDKQILNQRKFIMIFLIYLNVYLPYLALEYANEEAEKNQYYEMKDFITCFKDKKPDNLYSLINKKDNKINKNFIIFCSKILINNNFHASMFFEKKKLYCEIYDSKVTLKKGKIDMNIVSNFLFVIFYCWIFIMIMRFI